MSAATCLLSEEHFLCSICLDVLNNPVTIPCGHNFCKNCIIQNWRINRRYKCPLCKKLFVELPELHVNTFISEVAAQFRQSAEKKASEEAKEGEIPCDICSGIRLKALKSCLVCLASYCEVHLKRHQTVSALKRHELIEPLANLEDRVCAKHNTLMELFCKTDQACACQLCAESDHKAHDLVPLGEECKGMKTELEKTKEELQQMVQERQLKAQEFRESLKSSEEAADKETAGGVEVFTALTQLVETSLIEFLKQTRHKQKSTAKQAEDLIKELDQETCELMKRSTELKQLSHSDDHLHLLQSFLTLHTSPPTKDWTNVNLPQPSHEGSVARAVSLLKQKLCKEMETLLEAELKRVQEYAVDVVLDPDTAHRKLIVSGDGKQVNHCDLERDLPDNPERFSYCVIVLGKQSFSSGRFYYEVEVGGKTKWDLGVVSGSANRKGAIVSSPETGYWTLQLRNGNEYIALADPDVVIPLKSKPQKVGVFVDYEEGVVSFYNSDAADIIYSFSGCSFTSKLHPFFSPCFNDGGENSAALRISAVHTND